MNSNKEKAIQLVQKASNKELETFLQTYANNNTSVNFFTRKIIEGRIIQELDNYGDEEISEFLTKL